MPAKKDAVLDALGKAARGLVYTSETESGLEPFAWDGGGRLAPKRLRELAGAEPGTPVEESTFDAFLRAVPSEDRPKFRALADALRANLTGVKVYKVGGGAEKQLYVVGATPDGRWAGVKTTVVET
jgi:Nuclease A inhibitor-like protein